MRHALVAAVFLLACGAPAANARVEAPLDIAPLDGRATALAVYASGIHFGTAFGYLAGGWINAAFDWRTAFLAVGLPGLALALLVRLTVREPERGLSEGGAAGEEVPATSEVFRFLWALPSFRHLSFASALTAFAEEWGAIGLIGTYSHSTLSISSRQGVSTYWSSLRGSFKTAASASSADLPSRSPASSWYLPASGNGMSRPAGRSHTMRSNRSGRRQTRFPIAPAPSEVPTATVAPNASATASTSRAKSSKR